MLTLKQIAFVLAFFLLGCGCQTKEPGHIEPNTPNQQTPSVSSQETQKSTLTAFGDSLTEGLGVEPNQAYPAQLQKRLEGDGLSWSVVNAGLSGETSSGALTRLNWVLKTKPQAILLVTGANDGLRGLNPELTQQNLDTIVTELKARNVKVMLGGMRAQPNMGADYAEKFDKIYTAISSKHQIPIIPFFLEGVARVPDLNQQDGKHPTAEGYTIIVEHIYEDVKAWLEH